MNTREAHNLALKLMAEHGLLSPTQGFRELTDAPWTFEWSNAKRAFGSCSYRTNTITLSKPLTRLNDELAVTDTILHEIAHALTGPNKGHGREWQLMCIKVGAKPNRCAGADTVTPKYKYLLECPACLMTWGRHRVASRIRRGGFRHNCAKNTTNESIKVKKA